uniref:carbonic anhydrase n=1 Tax=Alexandrium catenella TaxID=2925 RepID=A0A7S1RGW1_ALECA
MEVQHVLQSSDGKSLVVSVMLQVRLVPDNPYLAQFWGDFPAYRPEGAAIDKVITNPFYGAFPEDRSFFVFKGSLTHPPCSNEVTWVVFQEPILISRAQRDSFREALDMSAQTGFLRYVPGKIPPKGVIEPWDTSIGMNNRLLQPQGIRQVVKVSVQAEQAHRVTPMLPANSWAYVVLALLSGALCLGVVVLAIVARNHGKHRVTRGRALVEDVVLPDSSPESERLRRQRKAGGQSRRGSHSLGSSGRSTRSRSSQRSSPTREEDLRFDQGMEGEGSGASSPLVREVEMQLLQDKSGPLPALNPPWSLGPPPDLRAALLPAEQIAKTATFAAAQSPVALAAAPAPPSRPAPGTLAPPPFRPLTMAPGQAPPRPMRPSGPGQPWLPLVGPGQTGLRR